MDNYQIETAQNVRITQNAASVLSRGIAYIIDYLIIITYVIIIIIIMDGIDIKPFESWSTGLVISLPVFLYHLLLEIFLDGQSIGKKAINIKVVMLDGSKPKFSSYLIRWLLRVIDLSLTGASVALITVLINGRGQRLGDIAAKTTVISLKRKTSIVKTIAFDLPDDYKPSYPEVTILSDQEIRQINSIFKDAKTKGNHDVILKLSKSIKTKLNIQITTRPMVFIETLLKDYNFYSQT